MVSLVSVSAGFFYIFLVTFQEKVFYFLETWREFPK